MASTEAKPRIAARTGQQFLDGLAAEGREVWMDGEKITHPLEHPALADAARSVARVFDLQHEHADECLFPSPETGDPSTSPTSSRARRPTSSAVTARSRRPPSSTVGLLGRTPDYLNVTFAGFAGRTDVWARRGNDQGAANLANFQADARRDLSLTHTIIHPHVDRSRPRPSRPTARSRCTRSATPSTAIVVRGARVLSTLAPFADELAVYPGQPLPKDAQRYALAFSIPMDTPGLKVLCRDSYSLPGSTFDHPFSTRFDEQDAFIVFDDVEVPRHRVFVDGDPEVYNEVMVTGWAANVMQQTVDPRARQALVRVRARDPHGRGRERADFDRTSRCSASCGPTPS